jgi:acetolactate synthase-1/2/3 large subunit
MRGGFEMASKITGGEVVYRTLQTLGIRNVFGIPSIHNIPIFDALKRDGSINLTVVRNEQAGAHAADGYYRATGELGVMIASTGPGTTNAMTGMYEAAFASSKVLLITGQVESYYYGKGKGPGHEADNQLPMLRTVINNVASPKSTQDIAPSIIRIVSEIESGKPCPGAIEIPIDLQYQAVDIQIPPKPEIQPIAPQPEAITEAAALLSKATKRVIIAGGGVIASGASTALVELAETLNVPVFMTGNGRGAISDHHPLCMGNLFASRQFQKAMRDVEVVLAIGTWFQGGERVWSVPIPGRLIHIDIDPSKIGLNHSADIRVIGDALLAINGIRSAMKDTSGDKAFLKSMQSARNEVKQRIRDRIGPDHEIIMDTMRSVAPDDTIFVRDMTVPAYSWGNQLLPIYNPRTTMYPTSGGIGIGLPLAIGAATGTGKKTVIIQGDGGLMVHIGELATAAQYQLPLVICVFTDGGYGVLRNIQNRTFQGRTVGVDLATPDFVSVAKGMGLLSERVTSVEEFKTAYKKAMEMEGPVLIDIDTSALVPITYR